MALLCISYSASNAQQSLTALDPNQIYSTGNAVTYSGWTNGVYQNQLTCWAWGDPGYCGPNPIVRPGGNINFSFGTTDLYQLKSIADILPNSGTGLHVNGYNFGFTAKNGNGWDGGGQDYLISYVKLNDSKGNETFSKIYDLNSTFNWTVFSYNETFTTPYASKDLSTVQYGFVGRDSNGWAGPYGPEVYNVNFSLKYSADPCFNNPTYSPTCAGYFDAISKLIALPPLPTLESTAPPPPPPGSPSPTYQLAGPNTTGMPPPPNGSEQLPPPPPPSNTAVTSVTPTANNPQPKVGEVQAAGSTKSSNGPSMSQIMSILNTEQSRVQQSERMVAEQVKEISANVTANAEAVAALASSQSAANANTAADRSILTTTAVVNSTIGVPGANVNLGTASNPLQEFGVPDQQQVFGEAMSVAALRPPTSTQTESHDSVSEKRGSEDATLKDIIMSAPTIAEIQEQNSGPIVNAKTKDNDAAGSITIASIATVPLGYETYSVFALRDIQFYPSTQVYKNQKTVDNARMLRFMNTKSDRLHEQLVNLQYNKEK